jgi:hypothetical protein
MKTFQKLALVSAIAAAPFAAQADLTPMDDSLMGNTTGQAGVTIEIDLGPDGIKVGSVVYTDTQAGSDTDGGSVKLENIGVSLTGQLVQTIDVDANGDLKLNITAPTSPLEITLGDDGTGAFSALNLVATDGSESEVINNLNIDLVLGSTTTTIKNLGNAASAGLGTLGAAGLVPVGSTYENMTSSMAIHVEASAEITDMGLGLFGYTAAQAAILAPGAEQAAVDGYQDGYSDALTADGGTAGANVAGYTSAYAALFADANGDGTVDAGERAIYSAAADYEGNLASGSAIQVTGVTVKDATTGGAFSVEQVIWAVGGNAKLPGSEAGVYIQMGDMNLDVSVADIAIGGNSIGSLAINGLELGGMTQRIYGH